ncbi:MAG: glycosyltransferase [Rubrivivax sp.]
MRPVHAPPQPPAPGEPGFAVGGLDRLPPPAAGGRLAEGGRRLAQPPRPAREPTVSYVTVVRNAVATLPRTLASVRAQRGAAVEHLVIDACSTDGTRALIEAHAGQIDYCVSEPDGGLYDALNKAMPLVRGSLVCVLNADDWLVPDAAALALAALRRHEPQPLAPAPRLILSAAWQHNGARRRLWLPGALDAGSWLRCPNLCHNGVYATPAALRAAGPYDTRLRIVADTRWLLAMVDAGVAVHRISAPTVHYVTGGLSGDLARHVQECARLLMLGFPGLGEAEAWTLLHAFYPWAGNLRPFADRCPPHLGQALRDLALRHAGDERLQAALAAAGAEAQLGQPRRVEPGRPLAENLRRGAAKLWHTTRDWLSGGRWQNPGA